MVEVVHPRQEVAEALADRALLDPGAEAGHLVVLHRVAVLVQHDVGVLGVVDAAVAEVQGVVGVGVEGVVVAEVVDVDRDRAVVGVRKARDSGSGSERR